MARIFKIGASDVLAIGTPIYTFIAANPEHALPSRRQNTHRIAINTNKIRKRFVALELTEAEALAFVAYIMENQK